MYVSVLLAGMFVFSAQLLVYAYISHLYPAAARATAVGAASGFGRLGGITGPIVGGALLTAGLPDDLDSSRQESVGPARSGRMPPARPP